MENDSRTSAGRASPISPSNSFISELDAPGAKRNDPGGVLSSCQTAIRRQTRKRFMFSARIALHRGHASGFLTEYRPIQYIIRACQRPGGTQPARHCSSRLSAAPRSSRTGAESFLAAAVTAIVFLSRHGWSRVFDLTSTFQELSRLTWPGFAKRRLSSRGCWIDDLMHTRKRCEQNGRCRGDCLLTSAGLFTKSFIRRVHTLARHLSRRAHLQASVIPCDGM